MSDSIAKQFHDTYERLAPSFGYETRPDTKQFDPLSANGKLMSTVCTEVVGTLERELARKQAVIDELVAARDVFDPAEPCMRVYDKQTARVQAAWSAARREATPLVHIDPKSRVGKGPCGECHLPPGETCDICGATPKGE